MIQGTLRRVYLYSVVKPGSVIFPYLNTDNPGGVISKALQANKKFFVLLACHYPLARFKWVPSTFSSHCQLSSTQRHWLTSAAITIFSPEIILRMLGIKPGAAESRSKFANEKLKDVDASTPSASPLYFLLKYSCLPTIYLPQAKPLFIL